MNTETQIIDFFKRRVRSLAEKKNLAGGRKAPLNHPVRTEIEITFDIMCEVVGAGVAGQMFADYGL